MKQKTPVMVAEEEAVAVVHQEIRVVIEDMIRIMVLIVDMVVDQDMMILEQIYNIRGLNQGTDMRL